MSILYILYPEEKKGHWNRLKIAIKKSSFSVKEILKLWLNKHIFPLSMSNKRHNQTFQVEKLKSHSTENESLKKDIKLVKLKLEEEQKSRRVLEFPISLLRFRTLILIVNLYILHLFTQGWNRGFFYPWLNLIDLRVNIFSENNFS